MFISGFVIGAIVGVACYHYRVAIKAKASELWAKWRPGRGGH